MSAIPIWAVGDELFFAMTLFASFALLTGLSFLNVQTWKTALFRALVYLGAGLACLIHAQPLTPGFSLDFQEVPLALTSSFLGTGWGLAVGTGLAFFRWLLLGSAGAGVSAAGMAPVIVMALLLRWAGLKAGKSVKQDAALAVLTLLPSAAITFWQVHSSALPLPLPLLSGLGLSSLKLIVSVAGFCLWSAIVSLTWHTIGSMQRYQNLATRDSLTGLPNRYVFEEDQGRPSEGHFLLLLDLDHFKRVNDQHGHLYGDQVLRQFGALLSAQVAGQGRAYRVGGEEFAVRLRGNQLTAEQFAEALRAALARLQPQQFADLEFPLSVSGGLVSEGPGAFQQADELLYVAKAAGRNQVVAAWQPRPAALPTSPFNTDSPGAATIRSLLRFLAEQDGEQPGGQAGGQTSDEPDLPGLLRAAILCVPGAEAGSLAVREGHQWIVRAQVGYSPALVGVRYSSSQMQHWHGDPERWQGGEPRLLTGAALEARFQDNVEPSDLPLEVSRRTELQANLLLPILVQGEVVAELNLDNLHDEQALGETSLEVAKEFALWAAAVLAAHERRRQSQAGQESALLMLGLALETRDDTTQGHTRRVVKLSEALGRHLQLDAAQLQSLRQGAYLHDLGKLQIPDRVLLKSGTLTPEEERLMQRHVLLGARLAEHFPNVLPGAREVIGFHHERWNGGGYPQGVSAQAIPLLARIFAVADVYDALTSARPYKSAWSHEAALEEIARQRGEQFDPAVVDAFLDLHRPTSAALPDPALDDPAHITAEPRA
ncbi:diguanylate cyclase [Deinococcus alpinitundrae]|uniref:diguanylate cyclase n=1 Tax=Deinococcus alpinitundrae TaxID=468913 RepID=UPI00137B274A|nr:diguanylate cyclase [Deinococcus alpinitundrae]